MDSEDKLLDVHNACALLGISRDTLYERRKAGIIQAIQGNRTIKFWRSEVMRCAANPKEQSPGPGPHMAAQAPPVVPPSLPTSSQDEWARCIAECRRRGIDPSDQTAVSAVMNAIYADDERAAAWEAIEAKG